MLVDCVRAYELPNEEPLSPPTAPTSLVTNPGFDDGNEDTQTLAAGKNGAISDQIQMASPGRGTAIAVPIIM
jgi:hypothetical protein